MNWAEVFYATATIAIIIFSVINLLIIYQFYRAFNLVRKSQKRFKKAVNIYFARRYFVQAAILKTLLSLMGGGEEEDEE
jgi:hypothetical protein